VASTTAVSAQSKSSTPATPPDTYEQRRRRDDFDEEEERRRRRRRDDYDDDDDLDDFHPRRIRKDYLAPHRGTMLLVLGLVGLVGGLSVCITVVIGPFCWYMAQRDLIEMREGRMDPSGESMTRAGLVLAIINTVFLVLGLALIAAAILIR
jgi:hypothetical protein